MSCACKVNQQITYLQKHFGTEQPKQKKIKPSIGIIGKKTISYVIVIPLIPLMIFYIIFKHVIKKPINLDIIFKKRNNERYK